MRKIIMQKQIIQKDSYENLKAAIKEAEEVLAKSDATVDEMNEQVDKLDKAVKALVRLDDAVDKSELNGYIENALTKTNDGTYTDNSWNSFQAKNQICSESIR